MGHSGKLFLWILMARLNWKISQFEQKAWKIKFSLNFFKHSFVSLILIALFNYINPLNYLLGYYRFPLDAVESLATMVIEAKQGWVTTIHSLWPHEESTEVPFHRCILVVFVLVARDSATHYDHFPNPSPNGFHDDFQPKNSPDCKVSSYHTLVL
jgi:hypothetical protein